MMDVSSLENLTLDTSPVCAGQPIIAEQVATSDRLSLQQETIVPKMRTIPSEPPARSIEPTKMIHEQAAVDTVMVEMYGFDRCSS